MSAKKTVPSFEDGDSYDCRSKISKLRSIRDVRRLIYEGFSSYEIARFIQVDRGEYLEVTLESLAMTVRRYISRLEEANDPLVTQRSKVSKSRVYLRSVEDIELIALVNAMIHSQTSRLLGMVEDESRHGNYGRLTNDAMKTMVELIKVKIQIESESRLSPMTARHQNNSEYQEVLARKKTFQQQGDASSKNLGNEETRRKLLSIFDRIPHQDPKLDGIAEKNHQRLNINNHPEQDSRSQINRAGAIFDPEAVVA